MDSYLGPPVYMTVLHSISIITCAALFFCYYNMPQKALGLKVIIILSISDFIFHSLQLLLLWYEQQIVQTVGLILVGAAFRFSIYWAMNIAFFVYSMMSQKQNFSPTLYINWSFGILGLLALGLSSLFVLLKDRDLPLILLADAPSPIAIALTGYFYLKSIKILKKEPIIIAERPNDAIKVLYRYAIVQICTMGPLAVYFTLVDITQWDNDVINWIMVTPFGLTGFTNAVVYFFQRSTIAREGSTKVPTNQSNSHIISKDASFSPSSTDRFDISVV